MTIIGSNKNVKVAKFYQYDDQREGERKISQQVFGNDNIQEPQNNIILLQIEEFQDGIEIIKKCKTADIIMEIQIQEVEKKGYCYRFKSLYKQIKAQRIKKDEAQMYRCDNS
ncbi:unnamed protein product [Paramecium sonneborni]|uniref:Uncharacterized protein n=1 Tax=Paramecium sonneborni TaxID=65129 RepID=A0A8S1RUM7_9CILI|nr:unnamed protein product [Paramecium sonneborni]